MCVCVCSFERVVAGKKPLNLAERKCIAFIRLKVTFRSLPNNMADLRANVHKIEQNQQILATDQDVNYLHFQFNLSAY